MRILTYWNSQSQIKFSSPTQSARQSNVDPWQGRFYFFLPFFVLIFRSFFSCFQILILRQPDEVALGRAASPPRVEPGARREHRDEHPELEGHLPQQVPRPESGGRRL